jgi:hypothetical protein
MRRLGTALALVATATLAAGCASGFVSAWKSPEWSGPPLRNILVLGLTRDALARRSYEDAMVARLVETGVAAEPSYRKLPEALPEREANAAAMIAGGNDGLIGARLIGVDQRETYVPGGPVAGPPGPYVGWRRWGGFYEPGYVKVDQVARIETQVWSLEGQGTLVWAGSSETVNPRDIARVARGLANHTVETLQKAGILPD